MKATNALTELKSRLPLNDFDIEGFTVGEGVEAMVSFYRDVRLEDCDIEEDCDMLEVQWSTFEREGGAQFDFEIARQLIVNSDEDESSTWLLSITFAFGASAELRAFGQRSRWCAIPDELEEFAKYIRESRAFLAVRDRRDALIMLSYEQIEGV